MGGEGSMFAANASLRNNRRLLREKNPFRKKAQELHVHHIESHETKHFSELEMRKFKMRLKRNNAYNRRLSIIVFICVLVVLLLTILWLTGSATS